MKDLSELIAQFRIDLENKELTKEERFKNIIEAISLFYSENLGVTTDEIAIFLTDHDKSVLSFACPPFLVNAGMIPVTSTEAIVSNVFRTGRSVIVNGFSQQKHLSVFEIIPTSNNEIAPIWKMIGSVITVNQEKIGVIEISKRGADITAVGEDFSQNDVQFLISTIEKLAPYIKATMPEDFKGKLK